MRELAFPSRSLALALACGLVLWLLAGTRAMAEVSWSRQLAPGVIYTFVRTGTQSAPVRAHVLTVDLTNRGLQVRPALAYDRLGTLERVSSVVQRTGGIAAINASFFSSTSGPKLPVGLLVVDKRLLTKSQLHRTTLGITEANDILFGIPRLRMTLEDMETGVSLVLWGINRPRRPHEVIMYTPEYGARTRTNAFGAEVIVRDGRVVSVRQANSPIPKDGFVLSFHGSSRQTTRLLPVGSHIHQSYQLASGWENVVHAVTGGPRLVADGKVSLGHVDESFGPSLLGRNPRTAVGVTAQRRLLLVVVDGRRPGYSIGMTYGELARFLVSRGAANAMGLDGGGSSAMAVGSRVVSSPSDGRERPTANALVIVRRQERPAEEGDLIAAIGVAPANADPVMAITAAPEPAVHPKNWSRWAVSLSGALLFLTIAALGIRWVRRRLLHPPRRRPWHR